MADENLDDSEIELLRDAIDNLSFIEGARDLFTNDLDDPPDLRV